MPTAHATMIPDLLVEHFEELEFLWGQRLNALQSPVLTRRELLDLEERIEAHLEGLLLGGEESIAVVKEGLAADDSFVSFAAAYSLLRLQTAMATRIVMEAFRQAQEGQLDGIRQALCHGPVELVLDDLKQASVTGSTPIAEAAIEVIAFHTRLGSEAKRLEQLLSDENSEVRRAAWRINGQVGFVRNQQSYDAAFNDKNSRVRHEALYAAGWTQQKWLLPHCRSFAVNPTPENWDAVVLLAILSKSDELQRILSIGKRADLGPKRFQILGAYGHPESVEELIRGMESSDLRSAVAAGAAFTKLTGCDIESDKRVQLPPEDGSEPDEFEKEFLDEAKLPDAQKARNYWSKVKPQLSRFTRVCRGFDLSQAPKPEILDQLDMESRWEACLRGKFEGSWQGGPFDLERFPQPKAVAKP
jgi:uncharacterized protein (TIGR02270 family)